MLEELAFILLTVEVLPIILLLIIVVPDVEVLFIPVKLFSKVDELVETVTDPILLFSQSTVLELEILIPITFAPVTPDVTVIDPVPVEDPIILPVEVPILIAPPEISIPVQLAAAEFDQTKF